MFYQYFTINRFNKKKKKIVTVEIHACIGQGDQNRSTLFERANIKSSTRGELSAACGMARNYNTTDWLIFSLYINSTFSYRYKYTHIQIHIYIVTCVYSTVCFYFLCMSIHLINSTVSILDEGIYMRYIEFDQETNHGSPSTGFQDSLFFINLKTMAQLLHTRGSEKKPKEIVNDDFFLFISIGIIIIFFLTRNGFQFFIMKQFS